MRKIYVVSLLMAFTVAMFSTNGWGQTTIFSENMGTPGGTTAIAANTFQNSASLTFSGTADVRSTTISSGYTGASGGGNVFITNTNGTNFQISGINTSSYSALQLSFAIYKSTLPSTGSELIVEVSSDGTNYTQLSFTALPIGNGTAIWYLRTTTGTIPSTPNLRIRFRYNGTATPQFRIDDVILKGTAVYSGGGNIVDGGVNFVGQINGYSLPTNCTGGDYRVLNYRKVSTTAVNTTDGRGQWFTTINVQATGGNVKPQNMTGGSGAGFNFISGGGCGNTATYLNKWNFGNTVGPATLNVINNTTLNGATDMGINMFANGRYTFVMKDVYNTNGPAFFVGYTTNDPVTISHNTSTQQAVTFGNTTITATISAAASAQEVFYLRYRTGTNDFSTGATTVLGTVAGTTVTFIIPAVPAGQVVYYYMLSTTHGTYTTLSDVDKSLATLRYADNSGSNYSYTMPATPPSAVTNAVSALTATTATLNGTVSAGGVTQTVSFDYGLTTAYGTTVSATPSSISGTTSTGVTASIAVTGVNVQYNYRVSLFDGSVTTNGNNIAFYTLANVPGKPTLNGATSTTLNVSLAVNGNPANTEFAIQETGGSYVQANGSLGVSTVWQTAAAWGTPLTIKGLTSSTSYSFQVKARNGDNIETAFGLVSNIVSTSSCTAPASLTVTGITNAGATVSWTAASATAWEYAVLTVQSDPSVGDPTTTISTNTDFATGLQSGTSYYLHVRKYCGTNVTAWVHSGLFTTTNAPSGIITWDPAGQTSFGTSPWTPTTTDTRITASGLIRGAGVNTTTGGSVTAAADAWGGYNWDGAANKDITFDVSPKVGYFLSLSGLQLSYRCSNTGPTAGALSYSINGGSFNPITTFTFTQGATAQLPLIDLSGFSALQNIAAGTLIKFRILPSGGGTQGTWYIYNEGLVVTGIITPVINPPVASAASPVNISCFTANWAASAGAGSYRLDVSTSSAFSNASPTTDLIISEYVEGSGNNKYIEIYNGTGSDVALSGYQLILYSNGNSTPQTTAALSGTLAQGATKVYRNSGASAYTGATTINAAVNFNGNDAIVLFNVTANSIVDIIGRIGEDPGTNGWTAAGGYQTKDKTLIRKSSVTSGITVNPSSGFPTLATEWDILNVDDVTKLGSHSASTPLFVSPYNDYVVNGITQQVTGLASNTTYYYRVRAVTAGGIVSANSNVITATTIDFTKADYRSVKSGNYSDAGTWEYEAGCGTWTTASVAPGTGNNVTIMANDTVTVNVDQFIGSGKTLTVNNLGWLNISGGFKSIRGAGSFKLLDGGIFTIAHTEGISNDGSTGAIKVTGTISYSDKANYIYSGFASQVTGVGLPSTVNSLSIGTVGTVELTNSGTLTISSNVQSLNLPYGTFKVGTGNIINFPNGGVITALLGNFAAGSLAGAVNFGAAGSVSGTVGFYNVTTSGGVDFGTGSTINNVLQINAGGYVTGNAPKYAANSTLNYNTGGVFHRTVDWGTTSGAGYPHHVQLSNATTLDAPGNGANVLIPLDMAGDLTIDQNSSLYMDYGMKDMKLPLKVLGSIILNGNLTASNDFAGSIEVGKNWTHTTGNFYPKDRAVIFNGASASIISSITTENFDYVTIQKTGSGDVTLANSININKGLSLLSGKINTSSTNVLSIKNTATTAVSGGSTTSYINGPVDWIILPNNSLAINYVFPIGKGTTYLPFTLGKPLTGNTSPVITVEAFTGTAPAATNVDNVTVQSLSTTEYWKAVAFTGNFSGANIYLTRQSAVPAGSVIARSIDDGVTPYASLGGTVNGNSIDNSNSTGNTLGTFVISASCPARDFSYNAGPYCASGTNPAVTYLNGGSAGTFTAPPGVSINSSTGVIDLTSTTPGTYTITNSSTSPCGNFSTAVVTITATPFATITYSGSPFCNAPGIGTVTRSGTSGGTYSSTTGLVIDVNTGEINTSTSTPANYLVTYTVAASGGCGQFTTTANVTITAANTFTWTGATNSNWNTASNWKCGSVPSSSSNVIIPGTLPQPMLSAGLAGEVNNISLQSGAMITVSGNELKVGGTIVNNGGSIDAGSGKITFNGTSIQNIPAGLFTLNTLKDLSIKNTAGVTLTTSITVANAFDFASGQLDINAAAILIVNGTYTGGGTLNNNGLIKMGGTVVQNFPGVSTTLGTFNNLDITNAAGVVMDANLIIEGSLTLTTGTLSINSKQLTLNGTFSGTTSNSLTGSKLSNLLLGTGYSGTLHFDQSTTFGNYLNKFTLNATGTTILGDSLNIAPCRADDFTNTGTLTVNTGTLNTKGLLVLVSDATGTARIASGNSATNYIIGDVTVQRFIPKKRAWRLVTAPVSNVTINKAWQEGLVYNSEDGKIRDAITKAIVPAPPVGWYGIHITGGSALYSTGTSANNAGFDYGVTSGTPSIRIFNGSNWSNTVPAGTLSTDIKAYPAYMLFPRGDRTIDPANTNPLLATDAVVRAKGAIGQTNQTAINIPASGFKLIGNPYPSPIDFEKISTTNSGIAKLFYVWDSRLSTFGGYRLIQRNGFNSYTSTPYPVSGDITLEENGAEIQHIQSGQGFFVINQNSSSTNVAINESHKSDNTKTNVFSARPGKAIQVNLNQVANGVPITTDGVTALFDDQYESEVNQHDVIKLSNFNENFALHRDGKDLMLEERESIKSNDTLFLRLTNTSVRTYQFLFRADNMKDASLLASLEDSYLKSSTPVQLDGSLIPINFSITSSADSKKADRFMIVFRPADVLPINFTNIRAFQKNADIQVEWKLGNESNISRYEVEKSIDGRTFTKVGTQPARTIVSANEGYNWLDVTPVAGNNFYRIKAIEQNGQYKYSEVVNVKYGRGKSDIVINPNPVTGNIFSLQFVNQPKGKYAVQLINSLGQELYRSEFNHGGGSATQTIHLNNKVVKGVYQLQVTSGDTKTTKQLFYE